METNEGRPTKTKTCRTYHIIRKNDAVIIPLSLLVIPNKNRPMVDYKCRLMPLCTTFVNSYLIELVL